MNIAGSILANYWRKHPVKDKTEAASEKDTFAVGSLKTEVETEVRIRK
jgi:hypothetical protein